MRLALFPLDLVLFPGSVLPLHIFEPRYRQLLSDCLAGDRRFGLVPAGPAGKPPSTGVIGTVAAIKATQTLPDGRSNIVVAGEERFMLRRYLEEDRPYPVGLVDPFEDEAADLADAGEHVADLRRLGDRCAEALQGLFDVSRMPEWAADAGTLSFQVAGLLEADTAFKQRFLGIRSALQRSELLLQIVPGILEDLEARAAVRARAAHNGTGGARPDFRPSA
jgi:ATP-dependent Lon protease